MNTKQVIVFRKDLLKGDKSIRKGKFAAQCCHASVGALMECFRKMDIKYDNIDSDTYRGDLRRYELEFSKDSAIGDWLEGSYAKVVLSVDTEEELRALANMCEDLAIPFKLITDEGRTEFGGVPTVTCLGIGPYLSEAIDEITGNLPLL